MKFIHLKPSAALVVPVALVISGWVGLGCSQRSPLDPGPDLPGPDAQDIIIVEQSELESIVAKYVVSPSLGEITALSTCAGDVGDDGCLAAGRQQLREEAKRRAVGLVVITSTLLRPTLPAQMFFRATVHQIKPR